MALKIYNKGFCPIRLFVREKGEGFYFALFEMVNYQSWGYGWTFFALNWRGEEGTKIYFCAKN